MTGRTGEHEPPRSDSRSDSRSTRPLLSRPRAMIVHVSLVLFALCLVARAVQLQLIDSGRWTLAAETQQVSESAVTPPRGRIVDRNGDVFVESRELVQLSFTPANISKAYRRRGPKRADPPVNARLVVRQGLKALGVHDTLIRRVLDTTRKWVELPELFLPSDVERIVAMPGVRGTRVLKRVVSAPPSILGVLGTVGSDDMPSGGIEQELDTLLRGVDGRNSLVRDGRGSNIESPALSRLEARPGHTVSLTINRSLQELAQQELSAGIARTGSSGGDVIIIDPRDGSVLAMAGYRNGKASGTATALAEPYEPGSVIKPFIVARALELKRVGPDEMINTEGGKWVLDKRTISDEHPAAQLSVRDVIRESSNIGAVKIARRFSEREEYETLRDFGFGTPTGVPYPAESRGALPAPQWHPQTSASVAMGYQMQATMLQIAAAYAAIANGGDLLQPALVREIRDADGKVVFTHQRTVIRRTIELSTAMLMRTILASVVDSGTARAADLATYDVAGKSGTARRAVGGRYSGKQYNSTFAGMFPAQAPQYVLVARLIDPQGKIFGGTVAGRIVKVILQGALATRDNSLDRGALAPLRKVLPPAPAKPLSEQAVAAAMRDTARFDSLKAPAPPPAHPLAAPSRVIVTLPFKAAEKAAMERVRDGQTGELRAVPSVYGLDARQAVRTLSAAGFHVTVATGGAGRTRPAAGTLARGGSVVVLETPK